MKATIKYLVRTSLFMLFLDFTLFASIMIATSNPIVNNNKIQQPAGDSAAPIKITQRASTYFQPTKPIYTTFSYVGVFLSFQSVPFLKRLMPPWPTSSPWPIFNQISRKLKRL